MNANELLSPENIAIIKSMKLVAEKVVEGTISGIHKSSYQGFNVEFAEHRQYIPGDDIKYIDWKLYGKFDRYFIKQFEEDTILKANIFLDTSESMNYCSKSSVMSKFQYGKVLCAALSYLMISQQDAVGLGLFSDRLYNYIPPRNYAGHIHHIFEILTQNQTEKKTSFLNLFNEIAAKMKKRSLIIIISDFFYDPDIIIEGFKNLKNKGHEVVVFHILDDDEIKFPFRGQYIFKDLETKQKFKTDATALSNSYIEKFTEYIDKLKKGCIECSIDHLIFNTKTSFDKPLSSYLIKRAQRRRK